MFPANPNQLEIIRQLETALNKEIPPKDRIGWTTIGYQTDKNGNIIGLGLYDSGVKTKHLEIINSLTNLTILDLSGNQITEIKNLENLTNLTRLSLPNNQITEIKNLENLTNLTTLYLYNNQITDTTPIKNLILNQKGVVGGPVLEVSSSTDWEVGKVTLGGNPLKTPPMEVVSQGTEAFLRWFEQRKVALNIVKINLLGNTTAGKTSLIKCLDFDDDTEQKVIQTVHDNFNPPENSTHGMQIWKKNLGEIKLNIVDFGGQEYFHGTYNLFLNGGVNLLLFTAPDESLQYSGEVKEISITYDKQEKIEQQTLFPSKYWEKKIKQVSNNIIKIQTKLDYQDAKNPHKYFGNRKTADFHLGLATMKEIISQKGNGEFNRIDIKKEFLDFRKKLIEKIQEENENEKNVYTVALLQVVEEERSRKVYYKYLSDLYEKFKEHKEVKQELQTSQEKGQPLKEQDLQNFFITALQSLRFVVEVLYKGKYTESDEQRLKFFKDNEQSLKIFLDIEKLSDEIYKYILNQEKLVREKNQEFQKQGTFERKDISLDCELADDYLELLLAEEIIYYDEENKIYKAPQYFSSYEQLKTTHEQLCKDIESLKTEQEILIFESENIENLKMIKLISTFGANNIQGWKYGFYSARLRLFGDAEIWLDREELPETFRLKICINAGSQEKIKILKKVSEILPDLEIERNNTKTNIKEYIDILEGKFTVDDFRESVINTENMLEKNELRNLEQDLEKEIEKKFKESWVFRINQFLPSVGKFLSAVISLILLTVFFYLESTDKKQELLIIKYLAGVLGLLFAIFSIILFTPIYKTIYKQIETNEKQKIKQSVLTNDPKYQELVN